MYFLHCLIVKYSNIYVSTVNATKITLKFYKNTRFNENIVKI